MADFADAHVESAIEALVLVREPRIGTRGLVGAKIAIESDASFGSLSSGEARRLAGALERAADQAEQADQELIPILETYAETRDRLLVGGPGGA